MVSNNVSEMWLRKYFTPLDVLIGCASVRPQIMYRLTADNNQQQNCQNVCPGYNYFGLKTYRECVCSNDVFSSGGSCSDPCDGKIDKFCGGITAYTVYKNGLMAAPSECVKLHRREQTLEEKTDKCDLKLPYICQKVPVNCGQSFIKTESSLNYTIESGSYGMNCEWKIEGYDNTLIRMEISFDIEKCPDCKCDSLKIYDAPSTIEPPNKTVCGVGQVSFNSTQKAMALAYSSDRSVEIKGFHAQWSFVPLPSQSTLSPHSESTINSRTGYEDLSKNKFSVGLIGGIVAAVVVITASVIVCVVVIRRRKPRKKREEANKCATEMVTSNNETESSGDINAVSAKGKIQTGMDSVKYGVVNKRQINNQVSSMRNIPIDSGRNSNIAKKTSVDDKGHNSLHHGYDRAEKVPGEATEDDEYNRLNEIMESQYVNKSDNVYNHVQGIDNDIYDHTADDSETHDRRASYSHVRGPFLHQNTDVIPKTI